MTSNYPTIKAYDAELYEMIMREQSRQEEGIELIASENIVPLGILEVQGSVLTNKYAEGYPKKRYYGGCEYVDQAEQLAIDRACQLFGAKFANVQPHSGSQANQAVFFAELKPGDQILGMNLSEGGHLTHGSPVNLSGKLFKSDFYGINKEGLIDYDALRKKALEVKPKMIIAGASAYSRVIDFKKFREVADECGALLLVDMAHIAGLVATGLHPSPVEYADYVTTTTHKTLRGGRGGLVLTNTLERLRKINSVIFPGIQGGPLVHAVVGKAYTFKKAMEPAFKVYQTQVVANAKVFAEEMLKLNYKLVSGGTDNHLILVDLVDKGITGKQLENSLDLAGITLNKNAVPNDPQSPFVTSGVRIGTPAITSRGMKEAECRRIVAWIDRVVEVIRSGEKDNLVKVCTEIKAEVKVFTKDFSIYFS